jgi:DNA adenine methylase
MYNGGKNGSGSYQTIINQIPTHDIYFELFFGSGAIYFNKLPAVTSFLMDKVPLAELPYNKIDPTAATFLNLDAISFLENCSSIIEFLVTAGFKIFMYLDPPYMLSSRTYQAKLYKYEMSDQDHIRLLTAVISVNFPCMISTYPNQLYSEYLRDWRTIQFKGITRAGPRTEMLYMNYQIPDRLHDYRYIGSNFRERERFKLIHDHMVSKFKKLPLMVRNSVLSDICSYK